MEESFQIKSIGDYSNAKITAVAYVGEYFVVADDKSMLKVFRINKTSLESVTDIQLPKNKICEKIEYHQNANHIICLVSGEIHVFNLPKLEQICELKPKVPIVCVTVNCSDSSDSYRILAITKKKKIKYFELDKISKTMIENKRENPLYVTDIPEHYQWYDDTFVYLTFKNKKSIITWINFSHNSTNSMGDMDINIIKHINGKAVGIDKCTLAISKDLALFLGINTVMSISPIMLNDVPVVDVCEIKNFIIFLEKNMLRVYMPNEQKNYASVQHEKLQSNEEGCFLANNKSKVIYITKEPNSNRYYFYFVTETPYTKVNIKLLSAGHFDEALSKINDNVPSTEPTKEAIIEQFYLDCAWNCIRLNQYDKAYQYCHLTNFDPFEFCYLFQTILELPILHADKEQEIKNGRSKNQISTFMKDSTMKDNKDLFKEANKFLYKILQAKRRYILSKFEFPKDNDKMLTFAESNFSIIDLSKSKTKVKLIDIFNYINATLVKIMIESDYPPKDIAAIIDHSSFDYSGICDFSNDTYFGKDGFSRKCALAYLYEKKGEYENALRIWKSFGVSENANHAKYNLIAVEARERTAKIFKEFQKDESRNREKNLRIFEEYIIWILNKEPEKAFKIAIDASVPMDKNSTEFLTIEHFLNYILPKVGNEDKQNELKEKFLLYLDNSNPSESYQTMLLEIYINKLFKLYPSSFSPKEFTGAVQQYKDLLAFALRKPDSVYNKSIILDKIKGSWLKEDEIYLYSELKMFNEALDKLLIQATSTTKPNFTNAEKFCEENLKNKSNIFCDLFKKIIELKNQKPPEQAQYYEDELLNLLKNYGDVEKLDPVFAFQNLPTDLSVSQDGVLNKYIEKVFKQYTSLTNKYKIARNISDMALIYKEKEVLEAKHKGVFIESETTCALCNKKIGNTFVVYPNMKLFHPKCATNMNVCPLTGYDFSKKKNI